MPAVQSALENAFSFLSADPVARAMQIGLGAAGILAVYLLFYTARDILLRTRSLLAQMACILLVAALPVAGFFLYLLVRPARTVKEREVERMLKEVLRKEAKVVSAVEHGFTTKNIELALRAKKGVQKALRPQKEQREAVAVSA